MRIPRSAIRRTSVVTEQAGEITLQRQTQLEATQAKCREFELPSFKNATLREEQQRELSPENEQKRQVERPLALMLCTHSVHRDVKRFVHQDILDRDSDAFQSPFELLSSTSAYKMS